MPNHCQNFLYLWGSKEELDALLEFMNMDGNPFNYNALIPYPEEYEIADAAAEVARVAGDWIVKDGYNSGGYEWCCRSWGTMWNAYNVNIHRDVSGPLRISFQSAWAPPVPVSIALADKFPDLIIEHHYFELGQGFCGGIYFGDMSYEDDADGEHTPGGRVVRAWETENYTGNFGG